VHFNNCDYIYIYCKFKDASTSLMNNILQHIFFLFAFDNEVKFSQDPWCICVRNIKLWKTMKLKTYGKEWIWYHCPCPICPSVNTTKNLVMFNHYIYNWIVINGHMQLWVSKLHLIIEWFLVIFVITMQLMLAPISIWTMLVNNIV
jgi:hypothetical protein